MTARVSFHVGAPVLLALLSVLTHSAPAGEPRQPPPAGESADVCRFGAAGDGVTDDTAAIQRAVDSGRGDLCFPRGIYRITRPITVDLSRHGPVSLSGSGTARIVMAGPGPAVRFVGTHQGTADPPTVQPNVWEHERMPTVDGLEIVGDHEEAVGIEAAGTMQLIITRLNVRGALHGIHLVKRNRNVIVSNCHLYENRGVGLFLDGVNLHQINVAGCHVSYNGGGGIVLRSADVCNLQITGCDIEANMSPEGAPTANVLVDGGGVTAELAITGCTLQHTHTCPESANVRIVGPDRQGRTWGNVTITGNVLSDSQIGIDLRKTRGVVIVGNTFWKGYQYNLRVTDSSNVVVGPNLFDRNPNYWDPDGGANAILFRGCEDVTITGLHVRGTSGTEAALMLDDCRRVNVTGCTILDCDNAGVLVKNVTASRLSDCLIRNDLPNAGPWVPLKTIGGQDNAIMDNMLDAPEGVGPKTTTKEVSP
ncbi:MAG TPA: right-handed parallel beta-helix repeat-containing protein [Thermoguttaceae bacterium]|nr:right-handed parallel beta-helix repeat-containing protein [Thermoguttaceae bacterium]